MAEAEQPAQTALKPRSMLMVNVIVSAVIGMISGGLGFAMFAFLPNLRGAEAQDQDRAAATAPTFVPFGEVVVNLDEGRLNRYLRLSITLQVDGADQEEVTQGVETHRSILRNWLISYLSDKQMDDIRGAAGQNRLRREIQNQYNLILSPDGFEKIEDVLFEEFTVQ